MPTSEINKLAKAIERMDRKVDRIWELLAGNIDLSIAGMKKEHDILWEEYRYEQKEEIVPKVVDMHKDYSRTKWIVKNIWIVLGFIGFSGAITVLGVLQKLMK